MFSQFKLPQNSTMKPLCFDFLILARRKRTQKEQQDCKQQLIRQALCVHESHATTALLNTGGQNQSHWVPYNTFKGLSDDCYAGIRPSCPALSKTKIKNKPRDLGLRTAHMHGWWHRRKSPPVDGAESKEMKSKVGKADLKYGLEKARLTYCQYKIFSNCPLVPPVPEMH